MENIINEINSPEWNNDGDFQKYDDDFWDDDVEIESPIIERNRSNMNNKERSESDERLSPNNA